MPIKKSDFKKYEYPYKLLLEGAADVLGQMYSVVETFKDEDLKYENPDIKNRTIGEMIYHSLCAQICFYTHEVLLNKKEECKCKVPETIKEALEMIHSNLDTITKIWPQIRKDKLNEVFKTDWGQTMTKENAMLQSVTHMMYHIGEICFLAGIGGFYKGTLG